MFDFTTFSEPPYYTFADENGNFMLNNIPYGVHDAVVNLDGHAPYKQRFVHEGNTSLGVNGTLYIIPELEAFRIEGTATDIENNIVLTATINVYDENNTKLFTTLNVDLIDLSVTDLRRKPHRYPLYLLYSFP